MSRPRAGSESSSTDDEAPPALLVRPTSLKRAARALSPEKGPRARRSASPRSPNTPKRRQFAPTSVDDFEAVLIPAPADWAPPQGNSELLGDMAGQEKQLPRSVRESGRRLSLEAIAPEENAAGRSPDMQGPQKTPPRTVSPQEASPQNVTQQKALPNEDLPKKPSPQETPRQRKSAQKTSPQRKAAQKAPAQDMPAQASPRGSPQKTKSLRRLRFASPHASPDSSAASSPPRRLYYEGTTTPSPPTPNRVLSPHSPALHTAASSPTAASRSPRLTTVPDLNPDAQVDGSSSPYGAQRSPKRKAVLSPERPLTMQMHYMLARENGKSGRNDADDETLADERAIFGNALNASLAPRHGSDSEMTLESVEAPVVWTAIKDLHARGRRLLMEVLEQRQQRVFLNELTGGYARFSALERQGVEAAIVERQKERCLTLRARATEVQQFYIELRDQVWDLERQKADADLLEAQIGASASDLAEVEALEAEVDAEEAEVRGLEAQIEAAEAEWQAQRAGLVALIAENKAGLDQVSAWVLDGWQTEHERQAEKAATESKQRLEEVQRELKLTISLRDDRNAHVYVTAEHLGVVIDLNTKKTVFELRHRGSPIYNHYLRLLESGAEPLREQILIWRAALEAQKAVNALARFGPSTFEAEGTTLIYKQQLLRPAGELKVRFEGARQAVEAQIDQIKLEDAAQPQTDSDDELKPPALTLSSVVRYLQEALAL